VYEVIIEGQEPVGQRGNDEADGTIVLAGQRDKVITPYPPPTSPRHQGEAFSFPPLTGD